MKSTETKWKNEVDEEEYIYADPEKMARVFNNLLKNGAAYSDRDTPIKIWTQRTGEEIAIIFENTGVTNTRGKAGDDL